SDKNTIIGQKLVTVPGDANVGIGTAGFGGGKGVFSFGNADTVPTTNPSNGALAYAQAGALKARGGSGTVTTMAAAEPHCPDCGRDFALEWENDERGDALTLCMWCVTEGMTRGVIARRGPRWP